MLFSIGESDRDLASDDKQLKKNFLQKNSFLSSALKLGNDFNERKERLKNIDFEKVLC
jgi:hypothetical protein